MVWLGYLQTRVSGVDLMLSMSGCGQVFEGHFERRLEAGHLHRLVTLCPLKNPQVHNCVRGESNSKSTFYSKLPLFTQSNSILPKKSMSQKEVDVNPVMYIYLC